MSQKPSKFTASKNISIRTMTPQQLAELQRFRSDAQVRGGAIGDMPRPRREEKKEEKKEEIKKTLPKVSNNKKFLKKKRVKPLIKEIIINLISDDDEEDIKISQAPQHPQEVLPIFGDLYPQSVIKGKLLWDYVLLNMEAGVLPTDRNMQTLIIDCEVTCEQDMFYYAYLRDKWINGRTPKFKKGRLIFE
jgi:hypothetical protein